MRDIKITRDAPTLGGLASAIARHMGSGWRVTARPVSDWDAAEIGVIGDADARLIIRWSDKNAGAVQITGSYPSHHVYRLRSPSIGVAARRGAEVIANEIQRRLLPEYNAGLRQVETDNAKRVERHARRIAAAEGLAAMLKDGRVSDDAGSAQTSVHAYGNGVSVRVRVYETTGDVEITGVSTEQLRAILSQL